MTRGAFAALVCLSLIILLAGCAVQLPRAWRETFYGPDPTPTSRLRTIPTPVPTIQISLPTPEPTNTRLPTLTPVPTRTATPTVTPTKTPATASLTLQQGAMWYMGGHYIPYSGTEDTYISAWNRNGNFADSATLSVRQGDIMAALIYFHLGDLPLGMPIYHAELGLYVSGRSNDTPMTIIVRPVLKPWLLKEVTWLNANHTLPWQTPGAKGETDRVEQPVGETIVADRGVWLTFDVTGLVREWLADPQANQGIIINGEAPNAVQYDLASADAREMRLRPRLTLTFATGTLTLAPPTVPTPTPSATPTVDPSRPEAINLLRLLPQGSTILARATGDIDSDSVLEIIAVYRSSAERGLYLGIFDYYGSSGGPGDYRLLWNSQELAGTPPISLDVARITGQTEPEILVSVASATGRMLYVFASRPMTFRLVQPVGGYFDGKDHFGESGYDLADTNGDGRVEILARHGHQVEVYAWDGVHFSPIKR